MTTTGELYAIIQELHLVDLGDAASYLGEEDIVVEESFVPAESTYLLGNPVVVAHLLAGDCTAYQYI
jgi:hypothetical protein